MSDTDRRHAAGLVWESQRAPLRRWSRRSGPLEVFLVWRGTRPWAITAFAYGGRSFLYI